MRPDCTGGGGCKSHARFASHCLSSTCRHGHTHSIGVVLSAPPAVRLLKCRFQTQLVPTLTSLSARSTRLSTAFGMLAPLQCLQKHCAGHQSHHQCEVKRMGQKQANWVLVRVQRGNASYARDSHGRACSQQLVSVLCGYVPMQQCEATRDACSEASVKHQ